MKWIHAVTLTLLFVGGVNWGLIGLLNLNLVTLIFGENSLLTNSVYVLVGLSTVYEIVTHRNSCKKCEQLMGKPKK